MRGLGLLLGLLTLAAPVAAHEFWIDSERYEVAPGEALRADLRVGEDFEGAAFSFLPPNFRRFEIALGDELLPVEGRPGDRPALDMVLPGEGLAVVAHVTRDYTVGYDDWEAFVRFVDHKGEGWVPERHLARGLPREGVRERYARYAKSLVAIGDGAGQDRRMGLLTEIVAGANPYVDALDAGLPVQVLLEGAPRAGEQVELFARGPEGTVKMTLHETDAEGRVVLPVEAGHEYLVNSVTLREIEPAAEGDPAWESLWASLTFAVPQ